MPLLIVFFGILFLLFLMVKLRFSPFLGLILTCLFVGILIGLDFLQIIDAISIGFGNTLGKIALVLVFGAMLGKLIESSGAAQVITDELVRKFGLKNIQYAILITGFLVGLPMMYNASFLVMIPLIYALSLRTKLPLMYLGIPLSATLSIAHAFLPPHPAPTYVSVIFGADLNMVLLYGLGPVIPACLLAGVLFSKFFRHYTNLPPVNLFKPTEIEDQYLPSLTESVLVAISPVIFMLSGTLLDFIFGPIPEKSLMISSGFATPKEYYQHLLMEGGVSDNMAPIGGILLSFLKFLSDANMALMLAVFLGLWFLGIKKGRSMEELMKQLGVSVSAIAMILLIIGAGGAFSEVLRAGQVNDYIAQISNGIQFNPLIIAFSIAAVLRFAVGSATVATMTAAPIVLPMAVQFQVPPELMVLATGSGSLMFSHFNDVGFWMFKEYFNLNIKQTFMIWSVMETIVAFVGLGFCLVMYYILL